MSGKSSAAEADPMFSIRQIKNEFRQAGGVSASCPISTLFDARKAFEKPFKKQ